MALTKVTGDFIKAGSITQGHLHSSHGITTSHIAEGDKLFFTNARVDSRVGSLSTSNLSEGSNLYYTDARARGAISVSGNALSYNSSTGVITSNFEESPVFTGNVQATYYTATSGGNIALGSVSGIARIQGSASNEIKMLSSGDASIATFTSTGTTIASDLTVSGGDIILGGTGRIQGIDTVSANTDAANKLYVDNQVAGIVDSAPGTLDTLNELAAALGDDANFSTTVSNNIAAKLPLAGGTLTGVLTGVGIKTPYVETTTTNQSLFLRPNGTGHLYIGDSGNGSNIYHYSAANDGVYTSFSYSGNYYQIDTTATSGIKIVDNITAAGNVVINGSGSSGNALNVTRGSDSTTALRVQNAGEVVTQANYFYAAGPGVSMYVQNTAVFRGGIMNDGSNADVRIADNLTVEGAVKGDIYYDRNNTGYYLNPESWSYIYGFSNEVRFAVGTYSDPDPGVSRDAKFGTSGIAAASGKFAGALVGTTATFSGNVTAPSFIGKLMGGANGAPDATIWCVSGSYTDWGIFYDENTPDVIQFKSSGNVKATISLDNGDYTGRNATFSGTISASGYNNSNWDTAYGWGNHASAGYLTSYTETNGFLGDGGNASTHPGTSRLIYSGQVSAGSDVLGMPTTNNANAFINLNKHSGEYNSQLGFSSDGNIYYRNFNNAAINNSTAFRKIWDSGNDGSGSGLDADTLDGSHASSFWTKSGSWYGDLGSHSYTREIGLAMTGGSEFVVLSKSGQGSVLIDGHYMSYEAANGFFGSYNSSYGNLTGIRASAANTLKVMQLDGGNAILEVTQDARAPIFYDLNDTTYYANPAGGSNMFTLDLNAGTVWDATTQGTTKGALHLDPNSSTDHAGAAITFGASDHNNGQSADAGIYTRTDGSYGTKMYFSTTDSYATGSKTAMNILHNGQVNITRSNLIVNTDVRAPIFYDSNDTGYYANPNSSSRLYNIVVGDGTPDTSPAGETFSNTIKSTGGSSRVVNFEGASNSVSTWYTSGNTALGAIDQNNSYMTFWQNLGSGWQEQFRIYRGYQQSQNQLRAPIFYDSGNTAYYTDPASRSILNDVNADEFKITSSTNNARWNSAGDWGTRLYTDAGYIHLGPANTSHAHIYTDRADFYFNKRLQIDGGTLVNPSDVRSQIYYDLNNTGYYADPHGTSNFSALNVGGQPVLTEGNAHVFRYRGSITSQNWNDYIDGTEAGYNVVLNMSGSNRPPAYTYGIALNMAISGQGKAQFYFPETGSTNGIYVRTGWNTTYRDWRSIALHNVNPQTGGSLYANIFYDSDNTAYSLNPASTSNLYNLELTGSKHTYLYINPGTSNEAMVRYNGGTGNTWYVGKRTSSDLIGTDNFHFYAQQAGATVVGIDYSGNILTKSTGSVRAPIFYDSNDTTRYLNPSDGATSLVTSGKLFVQGGHSSARMHINYDHGSSSAESGALTMWVSEPGITYHSSGIGGNIHVNGQYYGRAYNSGYGVYVRFDKSNGNLEHWTTTGSAGTSGGQGTRRWYNDASGNSFSINSARAPIFYDSNNTGYYLDAHSTSNLNAATFAGNVVGQNAYFGQDVGIGFTSGNIGGNLNIRNSAAGQIAAKIELGSSSNSSTTGAFIHTGASYASSGMFLHFQSNHISGDDNVLICYLDGDIVNKNNSYTQYSDEKLKENIVDATDKLEEVKQIKVRNFNFKGEDLKQIGVVAQELESIFPALVKEREVPGHEDPIKTVKYSVLVPILIKAMQEQQTIIDDLKSRLETLENQ